MINRLLVYGKTGLRINFHAVGNFILFVLQSHLDWNSDSIWLEPAELRHRITTSVVSSNIG